MGIPRKGLREIRTLAGRQDAVCVPYRAYMQITCLEMEKARRWCERKAALQRISSLETRLMEIETEKAVLLRVLENQRTERGRSSTGLSGGDQKPASRSTRGFRLRY